MKQLYVKTRTEWRQWLTGHHGAAAGIWLVCYKKETGKPTLAYDDAVEEALCFGWIDSVIKKLDEERYARKFTPRRAGSLWSALNKRRVAKLTRKGLMTPAGKAVVAEAKKSGLWDKPDGRASAPAMSPELTAALAENLKAKQFFEQLAPSYRKQFVMWTAAAKRQETRDRRVAEALSLLEQGKKLGPK